MMDWTDSDKKVLQLQEHGALQKILGTLRAHR
jgi:hypothetical protein